MVYFRAMQLLCMNCIVDGLDAHYGRKNKSFECNSGFLACAPASQSFNRCDPSTNINKPATDSRTCNSGNSDRKRVCGDASVVASVGAGGRGFAHESDIDSDNASEGDGDDKNSDYDNGSAADENEAFDDVSVASSRAITEGI